MAADEPLGITGQRRRRVQDGRRGGLLLLAAVAGPFLITAANRIGDGARQVYDSNGVAVSVSSGSGATMLTTLVFWALVVAISAYLIVRGLALRTGRVTWVALFMLIAVIAAARRDDPRTVVNVAVSLLAVVAAGFIDLRRQALEALGRFTAFAAAFSLLYSFFYPGAQAWVPCRPDKCTAAGRLMQGVFWAENGMAMYFIMLLATLAYLGHRWLRITALLLAIACIYLSGSRAGYVALAPALLAYWLLRQMLEAGEDHVAEKAWQDPFGRFRFVRPLARLMSFAPLVGVVASAALLLLLPPTGLTERGSVYAAIRYITPGHWLLGAGIDALQERYRLGHALFLMHTEHGQVPHVVNQTGLLGLAVFLIALLVLASQSKSWQGAQFGLLFVGPALFFATEATVTINYRDEVWPLMVLAAAGALPVTRALHRPAPGEPGYVPWEPSPVLVGAVTGLGRRAVALVVIPLLVAGGALAATLLSPRTTAASSGFIVLPPVEQITDYRTDSGNITAVAQQLATLTRSPQVLDQARISGLSRADLERMVTVENPTGAMVRITVRDRDAQLANRVAGLLQYTAARSFNPYSSGMSVSMLGAPILREEDRPLTLITAGAWLAALLTTAFAAAAEGALSAAGRRRRREPLARAARGAAASADDSSSAHPAV
ncbi:hypothetical protein ACQP1U_14500 [Actinomycetota bacterium]